MSYEARATGYDRNLGVLLQATHQPPDTYTRHLKPKI